MYAYTNRCLHMPRITLYVPDELKARMDEAGDGLNWSAVTQRAIREAIAINQVKRNPDNMTNVIERLRASKERLENANAASGKDCGATWAKSAAEYDELSRISEAVSIDSIGLDDLKRLIDPEHHMDAHDWKAFWEKHGDGQPDDAFAQGFAEGAAAVFDEVADQI